MERKKKDVSGGGKQEQMKGERKRKSKREEMR